MSDRAEMVAEEEAAGVVNNDAKTPEQQPTPENVAPEASATATPAAEQYPAAEVVPAAEASTDEMPSAETPVAQEPVSEQPAATTESAPDSTEPAPAEPAEPTEVASAEAEAEADEGKRGNVRLLAVGQQVTGTVKRIADFGAFVDIGVGRDGLIHISELSVRRVGKVTDVLSEGQEVTAWIKKLDRERNRISLTLIDPNTKTIRDLEKGEIVQGTVTRILPYGAFVDIGIGRDALLHVREMGTGYVAKPEDVVKVGDTIEARTIELSRRRGRVDLSLKGLREEPEPPQPQPSQRYEQFSKVTERQLQGQPSQQAPQQPEAEEVEESIDDMEVLSPMELAFKRAMEAEGLEYKSSRKKDKKRNRREKSWADQDDIITRTLSQGRK